MAGMHLIDSRVRDGVWTARVKGAAEPLPGLELVLRDRALARAELTQEGKDWLASCKLPAEILSDGIQVIAVRLAGTGEMLGQIVVQLGAQLPDNLQAELALLRAELDMLKAAFRRHCLETG